MTEVTLLNADRILMEAVIDIAMAGAEIEASRPLILPAADAVEAAGKAMRAAMGNLPPVGKLMEELGTALYDQSKERHIANYRMQVNKLFSELKAKQDAAVEVYNAALTRCSVAHRSLLQARERSELALRVLNAGRVLDDREKSEVSWKLINALHSPVQPPLSRITL